MGMFLNFVIVTSGIMMLWHGVALYLEWRRWRGPSHSPQEVDRTEPPSEEEKRLFHLRVAAAREQGWNLTVVPDMLIAYGPFHPSAQQIKDWANSRER